MLIVTGEQIAKRSIPASSPKQAVVVDLTELEALVGEGGVGVEDALHLHQAGAQADALTGVLLAQAPDKFQSSHMLAVLICLTRVNT